MNKRTCINEYLTLNVFIYKKNIIKHYKQFNFDRFSIFSIKQPVYMKSKMKKPRIDNRRNSVTVQCVKAKKTEMIIFLTFLQKLTGQEKNVHTHVKIRKNFRKEVKNKSALGLRRVDFILGDYYYCELFGLASKAVL